MSYLFLSIYLWFSKTLANDIQVTAAAGVMVCRSVVKPSEIKMCDSLTEINLQISYTAGKVHGLSIDYFIHTVVYYVIPLIKRTNSSC